jgi:hypothetical protein
MVLNFVQSGLINTLYIALFQIHMKHGALFEFY